MVPSRFRDCEEKAMHSNRVIQFVGKSFIAICGLALLGFLAQAQQPAAEASAGGSPTIPAETKLVLVDTVVTDKKGNYVRDLTAKDFKVWEDGKEQAIKSFSSESDPASGPNSQKHYLVLLFDNSTMGCGDQARAREAAANFIDS